MSAIMKDQNRKEIDKHIGKIRRLFAMQMYSINEYKQQHKSFLYVRNHGNYTIDICADT